MKKQIHLLVGPKFLIIYFNFEIMIPVDKKNEMICGGKDVTYEKLKQKAFELQYQKVEKCKKHKLVFIRNIYDDSNPKSEWQCSECGKIKYKRYYNKRG